MKIAVGAVCFHDSVEWSALVGWVDGKVICTLALALVEQGVAFTKSKHSVNALRVCM